MRSHKLIACLGLLVGGLVLAPAAQAKKVEVSKEGKILVVRGSSGGEPQLTAEGGDRFLLVGALREELLRLDGHKLKVWGSEGAKKLEMPTLAVSRYDLVETGGKRPHVGQLRKRGEGLALERGKEGAFTLKGNKAFLEVLEKRVGCKVWVVGELEGKTLQAFKFGWISCPNNP